MNKLIAYNIKDGRLWMGRPTFLSWLRCFFHRGVLTVKPIPGYREYGYYYTKLYISPCYANFTNQMCASPLDSVRIAEHRRGNHEVNFEPWNQP